MWVCKNCQEESEDSFDSCWSCGSDKKGNIADDFIKAKQAASGFDVSLNNNQNILITTAQSLENYKVTETIDIITSECVFGMNVFRDFFAGLTDFFGGRSKASQKVLRDARKTCLSELKREADNIGANAVIAVDLDYSEISGGGKSMLFLVASGTAVKVEPIKD